jgi:hypothetical protein
MLIELLDLVLKDSENGGGGVAVLKLGGERMSEKVILSFLLILLQSSMEKRLEV